MKDSKFSVLLIEDEVQYTYLLKKRFSKNMSPVFNIIHAGMLRDGLKRLAGERIDLVLLDLCLPDSQGLDTFLSVYAQAPEIPIVVLTALDDEAIGFETVRKGAQDFLVKGRFDGKELPKALLYAFARQRRQADLCNLSLIDELTGLRNRRGFVVLAEQQLKLAQRTKKGLLLFCMDLDGLKVINDSFGHRDGDRALTQTAKILKDTFRHSDVLARMGGDEFAVLAIEAGSGNQKMLSTRLDQKLKESNDNQDLPFRLSLSVGSAYFDPSEPCSLEELILVADRTMYQIKRNRKTLI